MHNFFLYANFLLIIFIIPACSDFSGEKVPEIPDNYASLIENNLKYLNRQVKEYPENAQSYYLRAKIWNHLNKIDSGYTDIQKAIQYDSSENIYFLLKAKFENKLQLYEYAITSLSNIHNYKEAELFLVKGKAFYHSGKHESSLKNINKYIVLKPFKGKGYYYKGNIHLVRGDTAKALKNLRKAVKKEPSYMKARYDLIDVYMQQNKDEKTLALVESSLNFKRSPKLYYNKAKVLEKRGKVKQALNFYNKVLRLDSNNIESMYRAGLINYKKYLNRRAFQYLYKVDSIKQGYKENNYHLGVLYYRLGKTRKSYEVLLRVDKESSNYGKARWFIRNRVSYKAQKKLKQKAKNKDNKEKEKDIKNNNSDKNIKKDNINGG